MMEMNTDKMQLQKKKSTFIEEFGDFNEEDDYKENIKIFKRNMFRMRKKMIQSTKFSSKRKQELEKLIKKPFFVETKISIRFPDQHFIQAVFSPHETISDIMTYLKEHVLVKEAIEIGFYLYTTPPVKRVSNKPNLPKTLER